MRVGLRQMGAEARRELELLLCVPWCRARALTRQSSGSADVAWGEFFD